MNLFVWILFGAIAGGIAHFLDNDSRAGLKGSVLIGALGTCIGGLLANYLFGERATNIDYFSIILAITGAIIFLFIYRALISDPNNRI